MWQGKRGAARGASERREILVAPHWRLALTLWLLMRCKVASTSDCKRNGRPRVEGGATENNRSGLKKLAL